MCALIVSMGIKHHIKLELHKSIFFATSVTKTLDHNNQLSGNDSPLADAIIDRIAHGSYRINITSIYTEHDITMHEVYGLDKALLE